MCFSLQTGENIKKNSTVRALHMQSVTVGVNASDSFTSGFLQGLKDEEIKNFLQKNYKDLIEDCENAIELLFADTDITRFRKSSDTLALGGAKMQNTDQPLNCDIILRMPPASYRLPVGNDRLSPEYQTTNVGMETTLQKLATVKNLYESIVAKVDTRGEKDLKTETHIKSAKANPKARRASFTCTSRSKLLNDIDMMNAVRIISGGSVPTSRPRRNSMTDNRRNKKDDLTYFYGTFLNSQRDPLG